MLPTADDDGVLPDGQCIFCALDNKVTTEGVEDRRLCECCDEPLPLCWSCWDRHRIRSAVIHADDFPTLQAALDAADG